ncbi:hemolysin XhlA family protein [Terrihalobacillus insolitus]|uniref:hemolysin XhlA family protein n=1 Tax=Terrihalobacillus insolitus TaxID=2950438 RepID=UPI002342707A|nr:hemolysin XhlA family protein [Terrihalobacillus insolitus]MDC3414259.1 hemolysin XhlA family protein [Terrihalobacillus insolitus]
MEERVNKLEDRMTKAETRLAVAESHIKDIKEDILSIKNNTQWILRLIIGAFIMAIIGIIIKGGV